MFGGTRSRMWNPRSENKVVCANDFSDEVTDFCTRMLASEATSSRTSRSPIKIKHGKVTQGTRSGDGQKRQIIIDRVSKVRAESFEVR